MQDDFDEWEKCTEKNLLTICNHFVGRKLKTKNENELGNWNAMQNGNFRTQTIEIK